jgi:hypothetical protein
MAGIIGNVMTYEHDGKQYVAMLSGVGGWAGIGLAAGLTDPHAGLGAVGAYAAVANLHGSVVSSRCSRCRSEASRIESRFSPGRRCSGAPEQPAADIDRTTVTAVARSAGGTAGAGH